MEFLAQNFPYPITRACTALPHLPAFTALPDGFLLIVMRIVQKINLSRPFSEIFATRITLSEESGKSLDTVHRAVKWLEDHGFIERERKAKLGYRGSKSPLNPTQAFLESLGIVDAQGQPFAYKPLPTGTQAHREAQEPVSKGQSDGASAPAGDRAARQFTRIAGVAIPVDLAWLCTKGMSAFGVLALMREAKSAKQRLSDIFQSCRKYLEDLPKNGIYAYLLKLIRSGRDFSHLCNEKQNEEKEKENSEYLSRKLEDLDGSSFTSKKSGAVFTVTDGVLVEIRNGTRVIRMMGQSFLDGIAEGRLVPHRERS